MPLSFTLTTEVVDLPYDLPSLFADPPVSVMELFRQLSYGELHDLKLGLDGVGDIKVDRRNQVIHFANEGLKRLHQRFELIMTDGDITVPKGTVEFTVPLNATVNQLMTLHRGCQSLTFNTIPIPYSIYVYKRIIHFPPSECEYTVHATYQNRHPILRYIVVSDDLQQPIYLSTEMWAALRAYIASEVYGKMNTSDAMASSTKYRNKYDTVCAEMEATGGTAQGVLDGQTWSERGFV